MNREKPQTSAIDLEFLRSVPLFNRIPASSAALRTFASRVQTVQIRKGQTVYNQGHLSTHLYLVRDGEIHIVRRDARRGDPGSEPRLLGIQTRSSIFGEVSFLSGDYHSSTAVAALDTHVVLIPGEAFLRLLAREPSVGEALSRLLSERLRNRIDRQPPETPARVFTVLFPDNAGRGRVLARVLAEALLVENAGRLLLIRLDPAARLGSKGEKNKFRHFLENWETMTPADAGAIFRDTDLALDAIDAALPAPNESGALHDAVPAALSLLKSPYGAVVVDAGEIDDHPLLDAFLTQSDQIVVLRESRGGERFRHFVARSADFVQDFYTTAILALEDPAVTDRTNGAGSEAGSFASVVRLYRESNDPDRRPDLKGIRRLARKMSGTSRGLALGGGGARAFAHAGVLEVFEDAGIDFDAVTGTSMGAIIAAGYALGHPAREIAALLEEYLPNSASILDKNIPVVSFFRGKKLNRVITSFFGDLKFEDLELPLFCNASDLNTGRTIVFEKGYVATALRATVSIPGVFPPVKMGNYMLVDGGVLNNLPGDILRMRGYRRVIGVNVTPTLDRRSTELKVPSSRGFVRGLREYFQIPPILKIISRSLAVESEELMQFRLADFDFVLHPEVAGFDVFDFDRKNEIIEQGRRAALEHLDEIKEALRRRLTA